MGLKKGVKYPAEPLTHEEVVKLLDQFKSSTPAGDRDLAVAILMVAAGLRISEALGIRMRDLNREQGIIHIAHGKGDRSRKIGLHDEGWKIVGRWIERRKKLKLPEDALLFCTIPRGHEPGGRPIHRENYRKEFYAKVKKAGLQGRVHPHALRHTFAFEAVKDGMKPYEIQMQLGHSSLDMTQKYINHLLPTELRDSMRKRTWAYG